MIRTRRGTGNINAMGDFRFKRLDRFRAGGSGDDMLLSVPLPRTASGKIYQCSFNPDAGPRLFLIGDPPQPRAIADDDLPRIRRQPGPGETVCPYSGFQAADDEFVHFDDVEAIKKRVLWSVEADLGDYLQNMAKGFNRRQPRGGLLSLSMSVKNNHRPEPLMIREDLLRELECRICRRPYGVYAIALFCPDCGAPNVAQHFEREVQLVAEQIAVADEKSAQGRVELAYRLMGNAHEDVLTAFETTMKTVYRYLIRARLPQEFESLCSEKTIRNAFQNIERGHKLFAKLDIDPFAEIAPDDLGFLRINIQKRHVVGHNLGIVDQSYAELTQEEQPGETVALLGAEIERFARICLQVIARIEHHLAPASV